MKFSVFAHEKKSYGHYFQTDKIFCFFGNKFATLDILKDLFLSYTFFELKQVHGNTVLSAPNKEFTADGSFTSQAGLALLIQTADCLPILIWNKNGSKISAVHAGWRGVQKNIISEAIRRFDEPVNICVGPHIQKASFEIDLDVAELFDESFVTFDSKKIKYFADLKGIVRNQIGSSKILEFNVLDIDTTKDAQYSSFRRDKTRGRQFSFIVIK